MSDPKDSDDGWAVAGSSGRDRRGGRGGGNQSGGYQQQGQGGSFGRGSQNQSRGGHSGGYSRGGGGGNSSNTGGYQQQPRSFGGGSSGSFGGGRGGGRSSNITFEPRDKLVPGIDKKAFNSNKLGWTHLPENKEDIKLPVSKGPGQHCSRYAEVHTNHFPAPIKLPDQIFHYEINIVRKGNMAKASTAMKASTSTDDVSNKLKQLDIKEEKKLPSELRMGIIKQYIKELEKELGQNRPVNSMKIKLISDYSNTLNSFVNLMGSSTVKEINIRTIPNYDSTMGDGVFIVTLKETQGNFKTDELKPHMNNLRTLPERLEEDFSLTRVEQVYNTLLKNIGGENYIPAGRSSMIKITSEGQKRNDIGKGLEALEGASVIYNMGWKPSVNIDIQHRPFIMNIQVSEYLDRNGITNIFRDSRDWKDHEINSAKRLLKGIKVIYNVGLNHPPRGGTVVDIAQKDAKGTTFMKNGKTTTVEQHFMTEFNIKLRTPKAICLKLSKDNVVPLELCKIKKGQSFNKKLEAEQTSDIMKYSRNDPTELKAKIDKEVQSLKLATDETLKAFGATFDPKPIMFKKTRIIVPPKIIYAGNGPNTVGCVSPTDGTWDFGPLKFVQPARTKAWGIVYLSTNNLMRNNLGKFEADFVKMAGERGLELGQKKIHIDGAERITEWKPKEENIKQLSNLFQDAKNNKGLEFIIVIIPKKGSCIYDQVKTAAEINVGIVTQCIASSNIEKFNGSKIANILLKLNMKLNGINNLISIPNDSSNQFDFNKIPCLFLGADVTHPPPEHGVKPGWTPSFAAITSNIQHTGLPTGMRIQAQVKPDKGAAEVIHNLDKIVGEFLGEYSGNMKFLPRKIVYFRDGVGEGQFKEVLDIEMRAIRRACMKYNTSDGQKYEPEITFIVVQKRHKTRAYCSFYKNGQFDGFKNCDAGTVIDQDIVHRKDEDFYLFSHKGMLGTSRSTHYRTIWDDSNMTMDQIQSMAYNLCYLYSRCNRAVRVPAPALYAHLAASRAKVLFEANKIPPPSEAREYDGKVNSLNETEAAKIQYINDINDKLMIQEAFRKKYPMHFV